MERIAISVIVPIYNTKTFLPECLDSILAQDIQVPYEVLLVDDGSTDAAVKSAMPTLPRIPASGSFTRKTRALGSAQYRH